MVSPMICAQIESLVLGSRTLSFASKKNLLAKLSQLPEQELQELKGLFESEIEEFKKIDAMERKAWADFSADLQNILLIGARVAPSKPAKPDLEPPPLAREAR